MDTSTQLHIYEEILLLALRDKEGTMLFGINYPQALAGAILAELILKNKIEIEHSGRKKFVKLINQKSLGNALLDECIEKIATAKRRARMESWVQRFANISRLKHKAAQSLCRRGILKLEEDKVLLLFTRKIYPEVDPRPEKRLMDKLYSAIFGNSKEIDPNTVILISICNSTGILKNLFDKSKLKEKKKRIKEITSGNLAGEATRDAVEAMQAAVMVAVILPAMTVSTTG